MFPDLPYPSSPPLNVLNEFNHFVKALTLCGVDSENQSFQGRFDFKGKITCVDIGRFSLAPSTAVPDKLKSFLNIVDRDFEFQYPTIVVKVHAKDVEIIKKGGGLSYSFEQGLSFKEGLQKLKDAVAEISPELAGKCEAKLLATLTIQKRSFGWFGS